MNVNRALFALISAERIMKKYLFALKIQGLEYLRNRKLSLPFLFGTSIILSLFFSAMLGAFGVIVSPDAFKDSLAELLQLVNLLLFILTSLLSFEYGRRVINDKSIKVLSLNKQTLRLTVFSLNGITLLMSATVLVIMLIGVLLCAFSAGLAAYEISNILLYTLIHSGAVLLVAPLVGFTLAICLKNLMGYSALLLIFVWLSPLTGALLRSFQNSVFSDGRIAFFLKFFQTFLVEPFDVIAFSERAILDSVYLLPTEPYRALLIFVWLLPLFFSLCLIAHRKREFAVPVFLVTFVIFSAAWGAGSNHVNLPRMTLAPNVNDISDLTLAYQEVHEIIPDASSAIPAVENYAMEFTVRNRLSAEVTVVLTEPISNHPYFTLYRGFRINGIADEFGNELGFRQEGDFVIIDSENNSAKALHFSYSGSGGGHYSNSQGIFLTSAFPYYPWPGKQHYQIDRRFNFRRGEVWNIEVKVNAPFDEVLTPTGQNVANTNEFVTIPSSSLTLMAGQISYIGDDATFRIFGGERYLEWQIEHLDERARHEIVERAQDLRQRFGLEGDVTDDPFSIVKVPTFPRFSNLYNIPVSQDFYVLSSDIAGTDEDRIVAWMALRGIEQSEESRYIFAATLSYLSDPSWYDNSEANLFSPDSPYSIPFVIADAIGREGGDVIFGALGDFFMQQGDTLTSEDMLKFMRGK